jgi:UDPglucose--hexose-1-phosphate uridylyltransferase
MSEFRQNPITKNWVLIAPKRAMRPDQYKTYSVMAGVPELDPSCVFCPGKEGQNNELYRYPAGRDWQIWVIENKFHALDNMKVYRHKEFYISRAGHGSHEVVVTRKHNEPVALQSAATIELSLQTFIDRYNALAEDQEIEYVQIFHNHGRDAGASLIHPHYQIMATPLIPPHVHAEVMGCYHYYQLNKTCIYCDIMREELLVKDRIVFETDEFVVLSAYASRQPFETWILPKRHGARFEEMDKTELKALSYILKTVLGQLYTKLADCPLNFYVHTMPLARSQHTLREEASYHWHLTVFPRITIWAGFEYATGIPVNPMSPEETAKFLRG